MDIKQTQAYEWAKNQKYASVAADYARTLAGVIDAITADLASWRKRAEAAEADMGRLKEKVCASFEKSDQLIEDQSDFVEELQRRLSTAEKVCSAAYMYIKHINSPLCVGWDLLLDALRKWTDERRPRDEGKEE